ncbi:hypothetical protein BGZ79_006054, partial [Entomortierella chlamydospora]
EFVEMSFHFYSTHSTVDNAPLSNACQFSEEKTCLPEWSVENPRPLNLFPSDTPAITETTTTPRSELLSSFTTRTAGPDDDDNLVSDCLSIQDRIQNFSPSNPAILFTSNSNKGSSSNTSPSVSNTSLTIVSTARTIELYSSGEYTGTFRGEPLVVSTPTPNPLFRIHVDEQSLPRQSRELLVKFFIPAKPPVKPPLVPGSITLHWLIIQGRLPPKRPNLSTDSITTTATSSPASSATAIENVPSTTGFSPQSLGLSGLTSSTTTSSSFSLPMLAAMQTFGGSGSGGGAAASIDLEAVRAMLGQIQLDSIPQGARNLMKAMEMQALSSSSSSLPRRMNEPDKVDKQYFPPLTVPLSEDSKETTGSVQTTGVESQLQNSCSHPVIKDTQSAYVTRIELEQMEARIMNTIDQKFQEMEERVLNKILNSKRNAE